MLKDRYLKAKSKIQLVELDLLHHFQPAVVKPKVQGVNSCFRLDTCVSNCVVEHLMDKGLGVGL